MEYVTLYNGIKMPIMGFGVYQITKDECERCVLDALSVGYRHIDTAQSKKWATQLKSLVSLEKKYF